MLTVGGLNVNYGRLAAVRDLTFSVEAGEIVCIVGPNGAGKSTTLLAIAGVLKPTRGTIVHESRSLNGEPPEDIVRRGIALIPEGRHVFATLSVAENLLMGATIRTDRQQVGRDMAAVLELFPFLCERLDRPAGKLSGGEQQQLVIGRALLSRPRLLMIDEPSLGLAPRIADQVYGVLTALRERDGLTLLIVEQSTERAFQVADRIILLRNGAIVVQGKAADIRSQVEAGYFSSRQHRSSRRPGRS